MELHRLPRSCNDGDPIAIEEPLYSEMNEDHPIDLFHSSAIIQNKGNTPDFSGFNQIKIPQSTQLSYLKKEKRNEKQP
jgi:hypothetical protein